MLPSIAEQHGVHDGALRQAVSVFLARRQHQQGGGLGAGQQAGGELVAGGRGQRKGCGGGEGEGGAVVLGTGIQGDGMAQLKWKRGTRVRLFNYFYFIYFFIIQLLFFYFIIIYFFLLFNFFFFFFF